MKTVVLRPVDTVFFRDSKPFTAGDATLAETTPPMPSVFYGALRTFIGETRGISWKDFRNGTVPQDVRQVIGDPKRAGSLSIQGPFAFLEPSTTGSREFYLPVPCDLVEYENGDLGFLRPRTASDGGGANAPCGNLAFTDKPAERYKPVKGSIPVDRYISLLQGEVPDAQSIRPDSDFAKTEPRIGIALTDRRVTDEGHLYTAMHSRHKDRSGYWLRVEGDEGLLADPKGSVASPALLQLGGERRLASLGIREQDPMKDLSVDIARDAVTRVGGGSRFKLVLLTPAWFRCGWRPEAIMTDGDQSVGVWDSGRARLVSAIIPGHLTISGFDLAGRRPKPIRRLVPAGSTYFFEIEKSAEFDPVQVFHLRSISDPDSEGGELTRQSGFGVTAVGGWQYAEQEPGE